MALAAGCGGEAETPAVAHAQGAPVPASTHDWTRFDWDAARTGAPDVDMGVTAANVGSMRRRQVQLDGTVDASAIYLHGAQIGGAPHDAFFVTTTYGKTIAIDAADGRVLWEYTPVSDGTLAGTYQITTATPVADPDRQFIYAASPDGDIQKLAVTDGRALWRTPITLLPQREKIAAALNFFNGRVIATTGGYIGDVPPYQGHVAVLDGASGKLLHVWNALCGDRAGLIQPSSCSASDAAIWARGGAVIDAGGHIYVATGNAPWDGRQNWGDAVVELDANAAHLLGNYTPSNTEELNRRDADLGSSSPVLLGGGLIAQGGKDRIIQVIDWGAMGGVAPHRGGEASFVPTPSGDLLFATPAVFHAQGKTWLVVGDNGATAAWTLAGKSLQPAWHADNGGTSPVVVDGLVFAYDPGGSLHVYEAATGKQVATLAAGAGHWNSPIVIDGRIALPEGNANRHQTSGVLDIWSLPGR